MNKFSLSALLAAGLLAGGLSVGSASAADLGGDCCADLEERVAELEATTARKGNRKVSLTISGWVGEQVMYWDDGEEDNLYQTGLGATLSSNFKFSGTAQISPGWSAGYLIHVEVGSADSLLVNADTDDTNLINVGTGSRIGLAGFTDNTVNLLQSYWFLKSEQLGKISVGQVSQASDNTAILVDGSGSLVPANWVAFDSNSFAIRNNGGVAIGWGGAGSCRAMGGAWGDCNGLVLNGVRYDSPTFAGFSLSAGWGEDDFWDVAIRYAGEFGGFKLAAAAAYNESTEESFATKLVAGPNTLEYFQAGVYLQHVPTGLFVLYNYGWLDEDQDVAQGGRVPPPDTQTHYVKAGIRAKLNSLGHTVFYGEYLHNDDGGATLGLTGGNITATATSSELDVYGVGVVQEIDAAAMSIWLKYRHQEFDDNLEVNGAGVNYQDFDYVALGALIAF